MYNYIRVCKHNQSDILITSEILITKWCSSDKPKWF